MVTPLVKMLELLFTLADPGASGEGEKKKRKETLGLDFLFGWLIGWILVCLFSFLKNKLEK